MYKFAQYNLLMKTKAFCVRNQQYIAEERARILPYLN